MWLPHLDPGVLCPDRLDGGTRETGTGCRLQLESLALRAPREPEGTSIGAGSRSVLDERDALGRGRGRVGAGPLVAGGVPEPVVADACFPVVERPASARECQR